jgi:chloramphenicol-sensitive protein RarD
MGFIQYFAPFIQFLVGVLLLHEDMPPERWFGFGLVWCALVILTIDMVASVRRQRRAGRMPAGAAGRLEPAGAPTGDPLPE